MTDSSQPGKKKKITYTASTQGIERAESALRRLGFDSKSNFAESQLISRSTVTKFFQGQPIQLDSFKRICKALKLNWVEISGIIEEAQSESLEINSSSRIETEQVVEQMQAVHRKVTVIDKQSQKIKAVITLEGDINSIDNWKIIESIARQYSGDSINIIDIKAGSIRLIIEGSQEDIKRLASGIKSRNLTELSGFPIEDIQILDEGTDYEESDELDDKWRLVQEIVNHTVKGRNLSDADLSDADLSNANLSGADLSNANLSNADLSDANLSNANLSNADLSNANLSNADLSNANLSGADLSNADLSGADLSNTDLSNTDLSNADLSNAKLLSAILTKANIGRYLEIMINLKQQGEIVENKGKISFLSLFTLLATPQTHGERIALTRTSYIELLPAFNQIAFNLIEMLSVTQHGEFVIRSKQDKYETIVELNSHISYRYGLTQQELTKIQTIYEQILENWIAWRLSQKKARHVNVNIHEYINQNRGLLLLATPQTYEESIALTQTSYFELPPAFNQIAFNLIEMLSVTQHGEFVIRSKQGKYETIVELNSHISHRYGLTQQELAEIQKIYDQILETWIAWRLSNKQKLSLGDITEKSS